MHSIPLRSKVWLRRGSLDSRLARGADAGDSAELAARAAQLVSQRTRRGLSAGLERVVQAAEEPAGGFTSAVPLCRSDILANKARLLELAADLSGPGPVRAHGVALVERLLTDGDSPLYRPSTGPALEEAARQARAALHLS